MMEDGACRAQVLTKATNRSVNHRWVYILGLCQLGGGAFLNQSFEETGFSPAGNGAEEKSERRRFSHLTGRFWTRHTFLQHMIDGAQ